MMTAPTPERIDNLILTGETRLVRVALFGKYAVTALQVRHPEYGLMTFALDDGAVSALKRGCEDALLHG